MMIKRQFPAVFLLIFGFRLPEKQCGQQVALPTLARFIEFYAILKLEHRRQTKF